MALSFLRNSVRTVLPGNVLRIGPRSCSQNLTTSISQVRERSGRKTNFEKYHHTQMPTKNLQFMCQQNERMRRKGCFSDTFLTNWRERCLINVDKLNPVKSKRVFGLSKPSELYLSMSLHQRSLHMCVFNDPFLAIKLMAFAKAVCTLSSEWAYLNSSFVYCMSIFFVLTRLVEDNDIEWVKYGITSFGNTAKTLPT